MKTHGELLIRPQYRPDIDGLRAIAVLSVVIYHAFPGLARGGFTGVDAFFVISGFLISTIIFRSLEKSTFSFKEFYLRRVNRIFPALILVLCASLAFGWLILLPDELNQLGKHTAGAGFISNILLSLEDGYFDNSAETKPLLHLWSLSIEEQFYLAWPFAAWIAWTALKTRRKALLALACIAAIASFLLNLRGVATHPSSTFFYPHTRAWELLSGSILAWILLYKNSSDIGAQTPISLGRFKPALTQSKGQYKIYASNALSLAGFALLVTGFFVITKEVDFPGAWAALPVLGTIMLIAAGPSSWINKHILSNKVFVWIGLISYPLYLWHWPILSYARIIENGIPTRLVRTVAIAISFLLAWLTARYWERLFRPGPARLNLKTYALCLSMIAILGAGIVASRTDFTASHSVDRHRGLLFARKGLDHIIGSSPYWFRGKNDWLFLGNAYDNSVAKMKLVSTPATHQILDVSKSLSDIASAAAKGRTAVSLIVGPDKSSIYPEYLPEEIIPSAKKYMSYYLDYIEKIPNLLTYDPTEDLLSAKASKGIMYWRSDTHWNQKGALVAYSGLAKRLGLPIPKTSFTAGEPHSGDLVKISKLKNYIPRPGDNPILYIHPKPEWKEKEIAGRKENAIFTSSVAINKKSLTDKHAWVIGDSFTDGLRPYFNSVFNRVDYLGHWYDTQKELPSIYRKSRVKPDVIIIVRVERSF